MDLVTINTLSQIKARLGSRIEQFREAKNLSRKQVSVETRIDVSTVSRIERGEVWPEFSNLEKIAHAIGVPSVDAFFAETVYVHKPTPQEALAVLQAVVDQAAQKKPEIPALAAEIMALDDEDRQRVRQLLDLLKLDKSRRSGPGNNDTG